MKHKKSALSSEFVNSVFTPISLVLISIVAIIAVAVALFQVNRGPVAPTAPESQPQAADYTNGTCSFAFNVVGATATPVPTADLNLTKSVNNPLARPNDDVNFTILVHNSGPNQATGVTVSDQIPNGITFVPDTPPNSAVTYNVATRNLTWNVGSIDVGQDVTLTFKAKVDANLPINPPQTLVNVAQVQTSNQFDPDSTPGNNDEDEDDQDTAVINPPPGADLELTKTVNNSRPVVGTDVVFTLELTNVGPEAATNVTVEDALPAGLTYKSHQTASPMSYDNATHIWTVGSMALNQKVTLTITATVGINDTITNYAQVQTSDQDDHDSDPGDDSTDEDDDAEVDIVPIPVSTSTPTPSLTPTSTPAPTADLSLTKKASNSTPKVDDIITYTIEVFNAGPNDATNVVVREPLAGGLNFISATPSVGSYNVSTGLWTIGTIKTNETKKLEIKVQVKVSGSITNTAQVQHSDQHDPDSTPDNNNPSEDDQQSATLNPPQRGADLSLTKRANITTPVVGQDITFTIEVHNSGPDQAENVKVKDILPAGLTFIGATPSRGSYNTAENSSDRWIWNIGSIAKDETVRMLLVVRVNTNAQIENVAQVSSNNIPDPDSTPDNNNPNEDDQDESLIVPQNAPILPKAGNTSRTTLFVIATGVIVLIIGAMGLLLLL